MSLFDDLLKKGGNGQAQGGATQDAGQGAAIATSTEASDIIITPESGGFIDTGTAPAGAPNIIATETPATTPNIVINEGVSLMGGELPTTQNEAIPTQNTITPAAEVSTITPLDPINTGVEMTQTTDESTPSPEVAPVFEMGSPLAPIDSHTEKTEAILDANTPVPITSISDINGTPEGENGRENTLVEMSTVVPEPQAPSVEVPTTEEATGGLFDLGGNTDTSASESAGLLDSLEEGKTAAVSTKANEAIDLGASIGTLAESTKEGATLDDFITSSLASISSLIDTLDKKKEAKEAEAAEMKTQKESYAQKEQDAYDAIKQIEKNKAQTLKMQTYLEKQKEAKEAKGSVQTDLAELSTKEAVKKAVTPRKKTTRTRRTTARKTTTRKTTTRRRAATKK